MKKKLSKIKKFIIKRPLVLAAVCFCVGILLSGSAFALVQQVNRQSPKPATNTHETKPATKKQSTPSPSSSPSPSASPEPSPVAGTPEKSATPSKKPSSQSSFSACSQRNSDSYVKYNNALAAENKNHQANLAELKQAYDNGEFGDPGMSAEDEDFAYQAAVEYENDRWNDATKEIYITYLQEMASNVCT